MTDVRQDGQVSTALRAWKTATEQINAEYEASVASHQAGLRTALEHRDAQMATVTAEYQAQIDVATPGGVKITISMRAAASPEGSHQS